MPDTLPSSATPSDPTSGRPMPDERIEMVFTYDVPPGYTERERLDVYLTHKTANASRHKVQTGIRDGRVDVNGRTETRPSRPVTAGDVLVCRVLRLPPMEAAPEDLPLDIVYEDDWLLIVNKAAGMVVHPAYGHRSGTLVNALLHHVGAGAIAFDDGSHGDLDGEGEAGEEALDDEALNDEALGLSTVNARPEYGGSPTVRPGLVHRIDKDTSGLLVVAKTDRAHTYLAEQFARHDLERSYLSLVWGGPVPPEGRIETNLARDPRDRKRVLAQAKGKRAVSHYETLEGFAIGVSLVRWRLETGRTHQIRAHAKHIGHPLLGDVTYGGDVLRGVVTASRKAYFANLFKGAAAAGAARRHARLPPPRGRPHGALRGPPARRLRRRPRQAARLRLTQAAVCVCGTARSSAASGDGPVIRQPESGARLASTGAIPCPFTWRSTRRGVPLGVRFTPVRCP